MILHATTVSVCGAGLLIRGPSGSGKSALALQMLTLGATLVADDRTRLERVDGGPPMATAPREIGGLIEARGLGLIRVPVAGPTRLSAVLDLAVVEDTRLPPRRTIEMLGTPLPLLRKVDAPSFSAALILWLRASAAE